MYALKSLQKPFLVSFEVTSQCDLECSFCSAQLSKYPREDLPTKSVLEIITKIANEDIYSIFLTGGEPLMRSDLPLIINECLNYGMNVSLSTNGIEASKKIVKMIASTGLEEVQVSIHAPNEIHDELVRVNGAVKRSFEGMRNLIDAGIRVTVASVATRMNYYLLPELAEQVAEMGAKYFRVLRLMPHSYDMLQQIVPYNEMRKLVERLIRCGNILSESFSEIWNSKPMSLLRSATPDNFHGRCGDCELKWSCYSARCVAYNLGGDILGDDISCYRIAEERGDC
jgi:MoaA/NifB/PqqE/SkfB family radical SAM enzyme